MPARKQLHPAVQQLLGIGAKALDAGLTAFADSLLETSEAFAEDVSNRVKRGRSVLKGEPIVEGEGESKRRKRRK